MQDKLSGLQARVDEWDQGQNSSINIELAMEIVRLLVLLFGEVFSFFLFPS